MIVLTKVTHTTGGSGKTLLVVKLAGWWLRTMAAERALTGQRMLVWLDYLATGLFATVGTIIAGQAGMNVVGTTLVGASLLLGKRMGAIFRV